MASYAARRLLQALIVLWGAVTVVFAVLRLVPGDPANIILGSDATAADVAHLREQLGLQGGIAAQYVEFLGRVIRLDFGDSFRYNTDAFMMVLDRIGATAALAVAAMLIALLLSFALGITAALRPQGFVDRLVTTLSLMGQSLPNFWVGIILILLLSRGLNLFPSAGNGTLAHLALPAFTLALPFTSILTRLIRSGLLEVLGEGYVQTARAKGLRERSVLWHHAVRNMLIPVVTVVGLQFGSVLGGTVVVEEVFSWPGLGRLLVDAIDNRDYTVVQASIAFIAAIFVFVNLLVDFLYAYIDPRVRAGS